MRDGRREVPPTAPMEVETPAPETSNKRKAEETAEKEPEPIDPLSAALNFSFSNESVDVV